jgi:hypothetical protein
MMNLQDSWKKLRHSKWTTLSVYALACVAFACFAANLVLLADLSANADEYTLFRMDGLSLVGSGLLGCAGLVLLVVRPIWTLQREKLNSIWICYWCAFPVGAVLAVVLTPPSWTDQALAGLGTLSFIDYIRPLGMILAIMACTRHQFRAQSQLEARDTIQPRG